MSNVIVIGGGHSLTGRNMYDLRDHGSVVGVNDAALYCMCHFGLSMDRLWTEHRYKQVLEEQPDISLWIRDAAMKNIPIVPRRMHKFSCDYKSSTMSEVLNQLNGSNSGTVAINFAMQMMPKRIYLLGYDMQKGPGGEAHWYPQYPWANPAGATTSGKFKEWASEFEHVAAQARAQGIEIINVTHRSAVTQFPVYTWEQFLAASSV